MFVTFSASVQGESHKRNHDKPCEDSSGVFKGEVLYKGKKLKTALAVVADGHGGDKYLRSRFGSKLAVETAREEIEKFIAETAERDKGFFDPEAQTDTDKRTGHKKNLATLEAKIIRAWRQKVDEHIQANPLTAEETAFCAEKGIAAAAGADMYGTTLIAALVTDFFWFALHIGDGGCVVIHKDGRAEWAVSEDEEQGFGTTHSLCNSDAAEHFRHNFGFETLLGATAASDGVTDSYPPEKYLEFTVTNLLKNFVEDPAQSENELKTQYLPMLSQKGSQDDVSLACAFNADAARPVLASIVEKVKDEYKLKELEKDAARKQVELDRLKGELDTWQKEAGTWKTRHTQEKEKLAQTEASLKAAGNDLKTARAELDTARQKITGMDARAVELEKQLNAEKTRCAKAESDKKKAEDDRDDCKKDVKTYRDLYNTEEKERKKAEHELDAAKKSFAKLRQMIEDKGYTLIKDVLGYSLQPLAGKVQPAAATGKEGESITIKVTASSPETLRQKAVNAINEKVDELGEKLDPRASSGLLVSPAPKNPPDNG